MSSTILADDHTTEFEHKVIHWEEELNRKEEANHERSVVWNQAAMTECNMETAEKFCM
jgi:hypothetical protein